MMMGRKHWMIGFLILLVLLWAFFTGLAEKSRRALSFTAPSQTLPVIATQPLSEKEFPCVLRGSKLIAQALTDYTGSFLESEDGKSVTNVAALLVYNPGSQTVTEATLELMQNGTALIFEITHLPPGEKLLVLEKNARPYSDLPVTACRCIRSLSGQSREQVMVTEKETEWTLTNIAGYRLASVTLYFKPYDTQGGFYLGGRTDSITVTDLLPGETRSVLSGSCHIVYAE